MMEAPSAGYAEPVLDGTATLMKEGHQNSSPDTHPEDSLNQVNIPSSGNNSAIVDAVSVDELFGNPIDTSVHAAVVDSGMSEKPVLRTQLEGMEAEIANIRKQELGVDDRLVEIQREKDDLVATRIALEAAVNLLRQHLGRPAGSVVVQLAASQPTRPQPVAVVPRRKIREGNRIDQFLSVLRPLMIANDGAATRQAIKQAWSDAGLFEEMKNVDSTCDGMISRIKHGGYITTDYRGTWTWTGIREAKTVEP